MAGIDLGIMSLLVRISLRQGEPGNFSSANLCVLCASAVVTYCIELYAKVASHPLTALKTSSKCSFIPYKLRFLVSFRLVMKHDPTFA
uniref:Uncharacterized protein n=1 Tax=Candidatus Kentrum sp. DK TaxID=2126562 RepID=A0A450SA59_9GAMM|nr:MAG: hypothetical protein BECKDK2373B_GA0170837_10229 [Candidatus Kentron sp. DK]